MFVDFVIPNETPVGFLFNEIEIRADTYVWMLFEHLVIVGLSVVLFLQERKYVRAVAVFLGLQVIDTIGWILFYEDPLKDWPFSFNQLKIGIFLLAVINEMNLWKKNRG
jgi:hypothetical protein